jgi:hypothetical protein
MTDLQSTSRKGHPARFSDGPNLINSRRNFKPIDNFSVKQNHVQKVRRSRFPGSSLRMGPPARFEAIRERELIEMHRAAIVLTMMLAGASPAFAQDSWSAMSTTAISVTGDIRISAKEIRFGNGARLPLAGTDRPGVLRVVKGANPVLKNKNLLCGKEPPTFVVLGRDESTESLDGSSALFLKIYNGKDIPPASDAIGIDAKGSGFCALYNYTRG